MKLIIRPAFNRTGYHVWLLQETGNGYRVAKPLNIELSDERTDEAFLLPEPTLFLTLQELNQLKASVESEMIAGGFKVGGERLDGILEATRKHLDDMRRLVFKPADSISVDQEVLWRSGINANT